MTKRGRPRGVNVNPAAIEDMLAKVCMSKTELAETAGITPGHLSDMLRRQKGASEKLVREMATALRCSPETIAPELTQQFVAVRHGDARPAEAVPA